MSRIVLGGLLGLSIGLWGCGDSPYLKATGTFAQATSKSATTLQGVVDFNHSLCKERAQLDYVEHRLERTNTANGGPVPDGPGLYWGDWYQQYKQKGVSWEQRCQATQAGDALVNKALSALSAYADALAAVAGNDYSGKDIGALVTDVDGLVGTIPSVSTTATSVLTALGSTKSGATTTPGPIGALGGALKQRYASGHVREIVKQSHAPVATILDLLTKYVAAVNKEEGQWEADTRQLLETVDRELARSAMEAQAKPAEKPAALPPPRNNPLSVLEFYQIAERWTRTLDATRTKQAAIEDALKKLGDAEAALVKADGNSDDATDLATVLGLISQVLSDIAAVQTALQGGTSR